MASQVCASLGHWTVQLASAAIPRAARIDQGPEFTSRAINPWAYTNGVTLKLIQAGTPTQKAYIESLNGKFRDECLNEHWLTTLARARTVIAAWRQDYNEQRPHSALSYFAPSEFAAKHRATTMLLPLSKSCFKGTLLEAHWSY